MINNFRDAQHAQWFTKIILCDSSTTSTTTNTTNLYN